MSGRDAEFAAKLREVTEAGYVNGFMACIIRIGEEAIIHPGQSPARLIERLNAEVAKLPAFQASNATPVKL